MLLTRKQFRDGVFARDGHCVLCGAPYQDAHHIMERRLWPDGGYYLDNGVAVCGPCHIKCESTEICTALLRLASGIKKTHLPPHLYSDIKYDKWGNIELPNGTRLKGELFNDESVQKIMAKYLSKFKEYVKYPRTFHLPDSPGTTKDDRKLDSLDIFRTREVVITEKMDGENATIYNDYYHARSIDSDSHTSRSWIKGLAAKIGHLIEPGWRVCGESMWAKHSIGYNNLEDYFLGFSIWDAENNCIDWDDTLFYFELMGISTVPVLYRGEFREDLVEEYANFVQKKSYSREGFVIRLADSFSYGDFRNSVAKWVRPNHVQTSHHWKREAIIRNLLREK